MKKTIPLKIYDITGHLQDYCSKTSIHGIKYLGEKNRPITERIWWLLVFVLGLVLNYFLIKQGWDKWNDTPVIVSFSESSTPIWDIPFPAVTICSQTKYQYTKYNDYVEKLKLAQGGNLTGLTDEEVKMLSAISLSCDRHLTIPKASNTTTIESLMSEIKKFAEPRNHTLFQCWWKNEEVNCSDYFYPILTKEGLCYTFNMLDYRSIYGSRASNFPQNGKLGTFWTHENGYTPSVDDNFMTYPFRTSDSGPEAGLLVSMISKEADYDYYCRIAISGYKVVLHYPGEIPHTTERYFRVPWNQEVISSVKPEVMKMSKALDNYDEKVRHCHEDSNKKKLRYFKIYTQKNCEIECLSNYTLKMCNCVGMFMPIPNGTVPICGAGQKTCLIKASYGIRGDDRNNPGGINSCNCLPSCNSINYESEISQADYVWQKDLRLEKRKWLQDNNYTLSRVRIFFRDLQFISIKRAELYDETDFAAYLGGYLSLINGMSLLSVIEIIYYFSLRLWNNSRMERCKQTPCVSSKTDEASKAPSQLSLIEGTRFVEVTLPPSENNSVSDDFDESGDMKSIRSITDIENIKDIDVKSNKSVKAVC